MSPILFNLAINPLVRHAGNSGVGFEIAGETVSALAYADDVALVVASPIGMQELFSAAEETARSLALSFNPRKCAISRSERRADPNGDLHRLNLVRHRRRS